MATAAERIRECVDAELHDEMEAIAKELLEAAEHDAPTLPAEEHAERHPGLPRLKDSGYIAVKAAAGRVIARVGFKAFYAAWIHERRDWKHDDGKAGYLGDNLARLISEVRGRLQAAARRGIRKAMEG